jgi:hypothetical protein
VQRYGRDYQLPDYQLPIFKRAGRYFAGKFLELFSFPAAAACLPKHKPVRPQAGSFPAAFL